MEKLRNTTKNNYVGIIRILLGIIFLMTGIMKLTMPDYGAAWSIQLTEANIPFYDFNYWFVPIFEVLLGIFLLAGYYAKIGALLVFPVMLVAIYVHLTVTDPGAFPSQPKEPYMPVMVIIMALIIAIKGGGNWSRDLKKGQE